MYKIYLYLIKCASSVSFRIIFSKTYIRIETGRYENLREEDRKCPFCKTVVENEIHVMCDCPLYTDLRDKFFKMQVLSVMTF